MDSRAANSDRQEIEQAAARLALELAGRTDAAAREELNDWLAKGPHHAVAYARARAAWQAAERLKSAPPVLEPEAIAGPAGRFEAFLMRRRIVVSMLSASVAALAAVIAIQAATSVERFHTGIGETRTIRLDDGSTMRLNTGSVAEVAMRDDRRHVKLLAGEAMFDVAPDAARPFVVDASSASLKAVGTAFNVRIRQDMVELTTMRGKVAVQDGPSRAARIVPAGKLTAIRRGVIAESDLDGAGMAQRTAWRGHWIALDGTALGQAIDEFNRYRVSPLVIGDPRIAALPVSGRFQTGDRRGFVAMLARDHRVRAIEGSDRAIVLIGADGMR